MATSVKLTLIYVGMLLKLFASAFFVTVFWYIYNKKSLSIITTITISAIGTIADIVIIGTLSFLLKHPRKFVNMIGMFITISSIGAMMYALLSLSALELSDPNNNLDN